MNMPAQGDLQERLPSQIEAESAALLHKRLAPYVSGGKRVTITISSEGGTREELKLEPAIAKFFLRILRFFSQGRAVTLVPMGGYLSTQQAADVLNISRPHLIKLIDDNQLGCTRVGRHRRLEAAEVLAYKKKRDRNRSSALDDLVKFDADEGLI